MHLSYRVASSGRGTGRDDAVDFRKILGCEHNVRGARILHKMVARFSAGYRADKTPHAFWAIGHAMEAGRLAFFCARWPRAQSATPGSSRY
jgi:hypothetical protein